MNTGRTPWLGPPQASFCGILEFQRVISESEVAVLTLVEIRSYADGCQLEYCGALYRQASSPAENAEAATLRFLEDRNMNFTVRYDSNTSSSVSESVHLRSRETNEEPAKPVLIRALGPHLLATRESVEVREVLWLWPLPPPKLFNVDFEWRGGNIRGTHTLRGQDIVESASKAKPYRA